MTKVRAWTAEWPITLVLVGVVVGLLVSGTDGARRGTVIIAVSVLFGGVLRLLLPTSYAGVLAVRRRLIDVSTLFGFGVLLLAFGLLN
jgi:hypothetical protein